MGTLTRLIARKTTADGAVYTVTTTEPDRTATMTVARTSRGLRVGIDNDATSSTYQHPAGERS